MESKVVLQPVGSPKAQEHFVRTIQGAVDISIVKRFISPKSAERLSKLYPDGKVRLWGVKNGGNSRNEGMWGKIVEGDLVLFFRSGGLFAYGRVAAKMKNKALAEELWKTDEDKELWENIYCVTDVKFLKVQMPYNAFNKAAGYEKQYFVRGFSVLSREKSKEHLRNLNLKKNPVA